MMQAGGDFQSLASADSQQYEQALRRMLHDLRGEYGRFAEQYQDEIAALDDVDRLKGMLAQVLNVRAMLDGFLASDPATKAVVLVVEARRELDLILPDVELSSRLRDYERRINEVLRRLRELQEQPGMESTEP